MTVLDTSLLLALLDRAHANHQKARGRAQGQPIWNVTPGVLGETTQTIRRTANAAGQDGNATARRVLDALQSTRAYRCVTQHDAPFVSQVYQAHPGLSYVDAWGICVALDRQEPLLTFDAAQQRVYERLK